jgi:hypothetical protein
LTQASPILPSIFISSSFFILLVSSIRSARIAFGLGRSVSSRERRCSHRLSWRYDWFLFWSRAPILVISIFVGYLFNWLTGKQTRFTTYFNRFRDQKSTQIRERKCCRLNSR